MKIGLALPQYDCATPSPEPLRWDTILEYALLAESHGYDSVWLSDHLCFDVGKYGGSYERKAAFEPLVTLGALAARTTNVRLGTLVLLEALRPPTLTGKAMATLDRISGGRVDVGLGAGWYEPDYEGIGMEMPRPGVRIDRLEEAVQIVAGVMGGDAFSFEGRHHRAADTVVDPPALQEPRPRVFVGGKGDRLLGVVARHADGWNTCWTWTPDAYRERLGVLEAACERVGRDPASVWRTLGTYALVGEDHADLDRRFERMRALMPAGTMDVGLDEWREGRLVGTVDEVRAQAEEWRQLGIDTLILGFGSVPFAVSTPDDVELAAEALLT